MDHISEDRLMSSGGGDPAGPGLIDVHHHFNPTLRTNNGKPWSVAMSLDAMDRNGIARAVASIGPMAIAAERHEQVRNVSEWNTWGASIVRDHPDRFGLLGALPLPHVDAAVDEIGHIYDVLRLDGVALSTSYADVWLTDDRNLPVFAELDRRQAVVFVHPSPGPRDRALSQEYGGPFVAPAWIEFPVNTARVILGLLTKGIARSFPSIRFVFAHGGGVMPLLLGRFAGFSGWEEVGPKRLQELFPDGVHGEFARFYFECAQACAPESFDLLRRVVPTSHILFGSDFSYFPMAHSVDQFDRLALDPQTRDAVGHRNAADLFGGTARQDLARGKG